MSDNNRLDKRVWFVGLGVIFACMFLLSLCSPESASTRYKHPSASDTIDDRLRRVERVLETHTANDGLHR